MTASVVDPIMRLLARVFIPNSGCNGRGEGSLRRLLIIRGIETDESSMLWPPRASRFADGEPRERSVCLRPCARRTGRRVRFLSGAADTFLDAFAQLLERHVKHRHHKYPDRACGKHASEHSGTDRPAADLGGARGNYQRQQTEDEG